jgi:hypothetical protein
MTQKPPAPGSSRPVKFNDGLTSANLATVLKSGSLGSNSGSASSGQGSNASSGGKGK